MQVLSRISVGISEDSSRFIAHGGAAPPVKDLVYNTISKWPGWSRKPGNKSTAGVPVSVYSGPISPVSALSLSSTTLPIDWRGAAHAVFKVTLQRVPQAKACLVSKSPKPIESPRKAFHHQRQAVDAIVQLQGRVLLADDMGLGKSSTALWAAKRWNCKHITIVCPASVKYNWRNEIEACYGEHLTYVIDGPPKRRADQFSEILFHAKRPDQKLAITINYDLLAHLTPEQASFLEEFTRGQALICDESHYLKSRKAVRTRCVKSMFAHPKQGAAVRLLLTGTPIRNTVEDLYSQVDIIRPGTWTSYWDFCKRHVITRAINVGTKTIEKTVGTKNQKELNAVVNTMQIRRAKEEVLNLPEKIHTYPELQLEGDMLRVYKAMKDLAILELEGLTDDMTIFSPQARSAVLAAMRCEQIAQGFCGGVPEPLVEKLGKLISKKADLIPNRPGEIVFPDSPKILWLEESLKSLTRTENKVVCFSRFNGPMHWLKKRLVERGIHVGFLHGALTSIGKRNVIEEFQNDTLDVLLCQVSMAEGFNLQNAQDCVFFGRDWSPAINSQAEDRLHRIGQTGTVNIQIPIVRNTLEKRIHERLQDKNADAEQALKSMTIQELKEAL